MKTDILDAFRRLDAYCARVDYCGWDVFDGLSSRIFEGTPAYRSRLLRLAWIQLFKRSPINLRYLAGIPKGLNPKGLALFASGLMRLGRLEEAGRLLDRLKEVRCAGYEGSSWGYNFPWESRAYYVPAGVPNIVATVFAANAFLDFHQATGDRQALKFGDDACRFILSHLVLFERESTLCFGYIPGENAIVHNANMLGAALLGRVFSINGNESYYSKSKKAISYGLSALNKDYLWPYGERSHHGFIDNFHTGYNLVSLASWSRNTGDRQWEPDLKRAYRTYLDTFWLDDGCPKYYHNSLFPIDTHCSAQGIITLLNLLEYDDRSKGLLEKVLAWVLSNMQDERGYFYYQKSRYYTNRIAYIRWAQAWMFYALAFYVSGLK
jgi:hypothetical protein